MKLTVAPTVDTARNVGVEARVSAEIDFFLAHVGAGGGGGRAYGQGASAWQLGGGGSIPLGEKSEGRNWIDLDLLYSGYQLHSVQDVTPDASPYAHGVRLGATYRRKVTSSGDTSFFIGPGFFGEASFHEGQALGIFGLPLCLHLFVEPHIKIF